MAAAYRAIKPYLLTEHKFSMTIQPSTRTLDQNAKFHAICGDLSKSGVVWMGKERTDVQWKVLLVSGHAIATKEVAEFTLGLEGEYVNLRESTALMSKKRGASLIEYALAFCAMNGVRLSAAEYEGEA